MTVVPLEVMVEDWNFASSSEADIAPRVSGSAEISSYVVVIADFRFLFRVEILSTDPTGLVVVELLVVHRCHAKTFFIEIKLHGFLSKLNHLVQEPVDTIIPDVRLIFSIILGEAAEYIEPN